MKNIHIYRNGALEKRGNGHVLPQKHICGMSQTMKILLFFDDFTKNHPSVLSVVCFVMGVWFGSKDWQT